MGKTIGDAFAELGIELSEDELAHYGKKGMRWGKRKNKASSEADAGPHKPDISKMSDAELKSAIARIKMERELSQLTAPKISRGRQAVERILWDVGEQHAKAYLNSQINSAISGGGIKGMLRAASKPPAAAPAAKQRIPVTLTPVANWPNGTMR